MGAGTVRGSNLKSTTHVVPGMTEEQAIKASRLDAPTVAVVLLVIPALVLHFSEPEGTLGVVSNVLNWAIYGWFLFEFLCMLRLAPDNREYLRHNKLDLTVLLLTVPLLPGVFQALWVLRLLRLIDMLPTLLGRFVNITLLPYAMVLAFIGVRSGWFLFEFLCMLRLAPDNREYLRHNKLDLTVLLLTVPLLPGVFQALWVLRLLRLIDMLPTLLGRFVNITLLPYAMVLAFIGVRSEEHTSE